MADQVNIEVGSGPVTKASIYTQIAGALTSLAAFIATLSGSLPEGVSPAVGVGLTVAGAAVTGVAQLVLVYGRTNFAKAKAMVMAGQSPVPVVEEAFDADDEFEDVDAPLDPETPKSDTDVVPPREPA